MGGIRVLKGHLQHGYAFCSTANATEPVNALGRRNLLPVLLDIVVVVAQPDTQLPQVVGALQQHALRLQRPPVHIEIGTAARIVDRIPNTIVISPQASGFLTRQNVRGSRSSSKVNFVQ